MKNMIFLKYTAWAAKILRLLIPESFLHAIRQYRVRKKLEEYKYLNNEQVFTKIYDESGWGKSHDDSRKYHSGSGSHEERVVKLYVQSIKAFLKTFKEKPDVVDLGCGDFYIGSQIREFCGNYIACDIVPSLIVDNKARYENLNVDFRILDLTRDQLPAAEIVFIRQVLQHLSNNQIKNAIPKIASHYKFIVLTEHLPIIRNFTPNLDKLPGPDVRLRIDSGVVLTKHPFNLKAKDKRVLCEITESSALIRTTLYQMA